MDNHLFHFVSNFVFNFDSVVDRPSFRRRSDLKRLKVAFWSFSTLQPFLAYCILTPNKFPHSSPGSPRIIQMRETSTSEGGNYYQ